MNNAAATISRALPPANRRAGFSLIEMLVVVGLIVVLLAIVLAVGPGLLKSQRIAQTKGVLGALDRALDEFRLANGAFPKIKPGAYADVPGPDWALPKDGLNNVNAGEAAFRAYPAGGTKYARRPDAAVFIAAAMGTGEVSNIIRNIPAQFQRNTVSAASQDGTPSMIDPWSSTQWDIPWVALKSTYILYVDAANPLAQELYGRCVNGRPYFVSSGPDGKFGIEDEFYDWSANASTGSRTEVEAALTDNITSYPVGPVSLDSSWTYRQKQ